MHFWEYGGKVIIKKGGKMICESCGNEMEIKEGTSKKTGKYYKFWGCTNYPECTHTEQVEEPKIAPTITQTPTKPNVIDNSMKSMLLSYAKDLVVAQINAGKSELGANEVIQDYKKLLSAL